MPIGAGHSDKRGHQPLIPPRVGPRPDPVPAEWADALRDVALADISDAVGRLYTCESRLRPAYPGMKRVFGSALTVKAPPGDNWAVHGALATAKAGDVLVIDWRDHRESCGAGVSALLPAIGRGLAGLIIDGAWRDLPEVAAIGFPMILTGTSPFSPAKEQFGEINVPVHVGGVIVEPGDLVIGDEEGVVVIPRTHVERVATTLVPHHRLVDLSDAAADDNQEDVSRIAREYWHLFTQAGGTGDPALPDRQ